MSLVLEVLKKLHGSGQVPLDVSDVGFLNLESTSTILLLSNVLGGWRVQFALVLFLLVVVSLHLMCVAQLVCLGARVRTCHKKAISSPF